jgi:hypothetical protein
MLRTADIGSPAPLDSSTTPTISCCCSWCHLEGLAAGLAGSLGRPRDQRMLQRPFTPLSRSGSAFGHTCAIAAEAGEPKQHAAAPCFLLPEYYPEPARPWLDVVSLTQTPKSKPNPEGRVRFSCGVAYGAAHGARSLFRATHGAIHGPTYEPGLGAFYGVA